jgi:UDP-N-acetylmuramate--alanine ligase
MFDSIKQIHFVGIGGSGMSGIAEVLITRGYKVSGSDMKLSDVTNRLEKLGAKIFEGHKAENIIGSDVVVVSTAIDTTNPEVKEAIKNKIPVIPRAEMLAELMRLQYSILIAGTHGKTTTTSIISWILSRAGLDPTVVIGGKLNNFGTGAKLGEGKYMVAEADESDGSFLKLTPAVAIVTNIDNDHLDYYKTFDNLVHSFVQFINKVPFYGWCVGCNDDANVRQIISKTNRKYFTYGIKENSDIMAKNITVNDCHTIFDVVYKNEKIGIIDLPLAGNHNILNTLAAIITCMELGVNFGLIKEALKEFKGVGRRLEIKGEKKDIIVVDDYGHHPREMSATWEALQKFWPNRKKYVVFQPHRYSRTQILAKEFAEVLSNMDNVLLLPIYPAGEKEISGVSSNLIFENIPKDKQKNIVCIKDNNEVVPYLLKNIGSNSLVLTLGAGNVVKIGEEYLSKL